MTPTPVANIGNAPLVGVKVLEIGQLIAIPAAGQALSDLGADVIKIEPASGDPARRVAWSEDDVGPMYATYNRGKRSVVLDLSSSQGREAAVRLAMQADVILQNARPGAMENAGLSAAALRARKSQLIVASVTGYASDSEFAARPGFDIAAQAESGMMSINGAGDGPPVRVGWSVVDVLTAHTVTQAVLAALVRRGINGTGATIEVALLDVAVHSMGYLWAEYGYSGRVPLRRGNGQAGTAPAADVIATADGSVVISAYVDEHFVRLANAIDRPHLANDARFTTNAARVEHRAPLIADLAHAFANYSTRALCDHLNGAGVVVAAIRTFDQVGAAPKGISPNLFVEVPVPANAACPIPARPFKIDGAPPLTRAVPAIGEHTDAVLSSMARDAFA